ncbi:MAG: TlpA family protein disulfide reductase [Thermoleophilia bacterium]|nr:TlpA family protein disulfide reductase [Thermoleophilia bacterium]
MGKASREKRERREEADALPRIDVSEDRRSLPVFWIVVGLMVVAGIVALIVTAPDDKTKAREDAVADIPAYADVSVDGPKLAELGDSGSDAAEGESVPTLRGTGMDDKPLTLRAGGGTPRIYVTMAHWCPHCQKEIPLIVQWTTDGKIPDGVEINGISTSVDKGQNNFPPATWLAREDWPYDTLIDDELGTAADALGVSGFPFIVFADADGKVVKRTSGELSLEDFTKYADEIAKTAPAADSSSNGAQG